MKKLFVLLIAAFFMPGICQGFDSQVKAGDIILLEGETLPFRGFDIQVSFLKSFCGLEHFPTHAEVVVNDKEITFSSIQPDGTGYSTVGTRLKQFGKGILLRNPTLTDEQIESVIATANDIDGDYEQLKYLSLIHI